MQSFNMKKDASSKKVIGQLIFVKPSQCEFSDIPELNRERESWSLEKIDGLTTSIKQRGIVVALKGYLEGNKFKITNGRQRMTSVQELERQGITKAENGRPLLVPITVTSKPESKEDIADALEDSLVDNLHRYEDDVVTRRQSFRTLRDLGKTLEEIGQATGYSHVYVSQVLDVSSVKPLWDSVRAGKIGVKEASAFVSSKFQKLSKDKKPLKDKAGNKVYDEDKIKTALTETIRKANESGRSKVKTSDVTGIAGARKVTGENRKKQGDAWLKALVDDTENTPQEIVLLLECYFLKRSIVETIKFAKTKFKIDMSWLSDVDFSSPKEKKAAKKAAKKASKATKKNPMVDDDDDEDTDSDLTAGEDYDE